MDRSSPGLIMGVNERTLHRKADNQEFTIYDVETTVGTLNTTVKQLAEHARTLINTPLILGWKEKQNGNYTNRYLETLEPAPQTSMPIPQPQTPAPGSIQAPPVPPVVSNYDMTAPVGREEAIWRQTATKTAAQFNNKDLGEYWARVEMLLDFYRTGAIPQPQPPQATEDPVTDDDIPF